MCSIIGIVSPKRALPFEKSEKKTLARVIALNEYRGGSGAGVWSPKIGLKKSVKLDAKGEVYTRKDDNNIMVHLRASTSGQVIDKFCHPFQSKHIVLAHNGHITNYRHFRVPMDTLAGVKQVRKGESAIRELQGWYVLAWYNLKSGLFHLLNQSGAIDYGWAGGRLWYASTNLKTALGDKLGAVHSLPSGKHIVFNPFGKVVKVQSEKDYSPRVFVPRPSPLGFGWTPKTSYFPALNGTQKWSINQLQKIEDEVNEERLNDYNSDIPACNYLPIKYRLNVDYSGSNE